MKDPTAASQLPNEEGPSHWMVEALVFTLQAALVQKTSSKRAPRSITEVTAVKSHSHFTCDMLTQCANLLLIHVCVSIELQQHRLFLQSREGVEAVLAYPVAVCELLNFRCCDEFHFCSLYGQRINAYGREGWPQRALLCLWPMFSVLSAFSVKAPWRLHALLYGERWIFFFFFFTALQICDHSESH